MTHVSTLSTIQILLLSGAAQRPDGSLLPLPDTINRSGGIWKAVKALLGRGLVEEADVTDPECGWRKEGDRHIGVLITAAGRTAIGAPLKVDSGSRDGPAPGDSPVPAPEPAKPTKATTVLSLLDRDEGATLDELVQATGWLPHTIRAALTRLRQKGRNIDRRKRGEATCYHIVTGAGA